MVCVYALSPLRSPMIFARLAGKVKYTSKHASGMEAACMRKKSKKPLRRKIVLRSARSGSCEVFSSQQPEFTMLKTQL